MGGEVTDPIEPPAPPSRAALAKPVGEGPSDAMQRLLAAPMDARGYVDLRHPTTQGPQAYFADHQKTNQTAISTHLSPAAQAVLTAQAKQRCLFEWSNAKDPPCHPSDPNWNGCAQCIDRHGVAATLRASAEQMRSDYPASIEQMPENARRWYRLGFGAASNYDRSWLGAVATELERADG